MPAADGIEPLLKLAARRDAADVMEVLSLAFANLSAANPSNCRYDICQPCCDDSFMKHLYQWLKPTLVKICSSHPAVERYCESSRDKCRTVASDHLRSNEQTCAVIIYTDRLQLILLHQLLLKE